jgi:hypothetical protein
MLFPPSICSIFFNIESLLFLLSLNVLWDMLMAAIPSFLRSFHSQVQVCPIKHWEPIGREGFKY